MEYSRMIKLLLPSGNLINLHLGGEDKELKDLISTITEISPNQVKGIKDSKGNYYTISSAIKSINIVNNSDDYFELIYSKQYMPEHSKQLSCKLPFDDCYPFDPRHQIILNTTPNVGNYYANYIFEKPCSGMQKLRNKTKVRNLPLISSPFNINQKNKNSLSLQLLRRLFEEKKINQKVYHYIMNLINNNYEEIILQFDLYSKGKIRDTILIQLLYSYYNKEILTGEQESKRKSNDSIDEQEIREIILLELKEHLNKEDWSVIKKMAKYENEEIISALIEYFQKKNLANLLSSIHFVLNRYKSKMNKRKKPNSSIRLITNPKEKTYAKSKSVVESSQSIVPSSQSINNKKSKSYLLIQIRKCLSIINKVVLEYIQAKYPKELDSLISFYSQNEKKEDLNTLLNEKCQIILKNTILKELSTQTLDEISILISENDNKIVDSFTSFRKKKFPVHELKSDLINLTNHTQVSIKYKSSITDIPQAIPFEAEQKSSNEEKNKEKEKEQDQIQSFLLDLEGLSLSDKDKDQLLEMMKMKNSKLYSLINEYSNGKPPNDLKEKLLKLTNKRHFGTILTKLKSRDSPSPIKNTLTQLATQPSFPPPMKSNSKTNTYTTFTEILAYLEKEYTLNKEKSTFLLNKFNDHNEVLHSLWDCYTKNGNCSDLVESILLFIQKRYIDTSLKDGNVVRHKNDDHPKTPENIKNSKDDLIFFLKQSEKQIHYKEKNILEKQQEIISLLFKEACIEKKTFDIISEKIKQDDQCLISTFEVYAVTRDHNEFIETLQVIAELSDNYKGVFLSMLNQSNLEDNEKEILKVLYSQKQEMLFSSLELYTENKDNEELFDTFKTLCRKNKDIL